jgi:hypothetical protein
VKPWLRNLLIVVLALAVLGGVAVVSFSLGARHAAQPAFAAFGEEQGGGRIVVQRGGEGGSRVFSWGRGGFLPFARMSGDEGRADQAGQFTMNRSGRFYGMVLFSLARLALTVAVIGALVLGVVAFFRTGGWRPAAAPARRGRR